MISKIILSLMAVIFMAAGESAVDAGKSKKAPPAEMKPFPALPAAGKKCPLGPGGDYFTYRFVEKIKIGAVILRIEVFDAKGKTLTDYEITAEYGMPSMKEMGTSGIQTFKKNKKGAYLLPVNVSMPGEWEVNLLFSKNKQEALRGSFKFNL